MASAANETATDGSFHFIDKTTQSERKNETANLKPYVKKNDR